MKPHITNRLSLKKHAVSKLSNSDKANIRAGNAITTSWIRCTGIFCCEPATTEFTPLITQIYNCFPTEEIEPGP